MENEIKEIIAAEPKKEKKKEHNPMDYVTIPVKEYRKMVQKITKVKAEKAALVDIGKAREEREQYRRWWQEEQRNKETLEKALAEAKRQLKELLGVEEIDEQG